MEEILKTTLLEYEKSAFIIDLIKHTSGKQYISILQTIQDEESDHKRAIKINPSLLTDIVKVLNSYFKIITNIKDDNQLPNKNESITDLISKTLTESQKVAIQSRYLRGVSIPDLTIQFDCNKELILQILNNNGIAIVEPKPTPTKSHKKFRKRSK